MFNCYSYINNKHLVSSKISIEIKKPKAAKILGNVDGQTGFLFSIGGSNSSIVKNAS
jgi:hypothetical protein